MTTKTPRLYLHDVIRSCDAIERFLTGRTLEDYLSDDMLRSAVERQCEIIGEALNQALRIQPSLSERISNAKKIVAFRNRLIHGYGAVKDDIVWDTVVRDTPLLRREVDELLRSDESL